jgi:hypothetical protein
MANKHRLVYFGPQGNAPAIDVGDWTCNRCLEGFSNNPKEKIIIAKMDNGGFGVYHVSCFLAWHGDHTLKQLLTGI